MRRERARAASSEPLDLDHFLPYRLSLLSNTVSNAIARRYSERFGLSIPAWRVMAVLGRFPGASANEIALRTQMDKVQVSRAVAQLVKAKRVRREVSAEDRRVAHLCLTPAGYAVYGEIAPLARSFEEALLAALSRPERAVLDAAIRRLQAAAEGL